MEAKDNVSTNSSCCVACGYVSEFFGTRQGYTGGLKVKQFYVNDRDWFLGSKFVFKDRDLRPLSTEPATHAFLQRETSIPIPTIRMFWEEDGERFRTIEDRIQGETLDKVWENLSDDERDNIAQQTADYLKQLRAMTSNRIEGVNGAPLYSEILFGALDEPNGPFDTREGFWEALAEHLRERGAPSEKINKLGKDLPPLEPYTFTSGKVDASCVVVKDKKVVGITEWGTAGYLPFWYEYAKASIFYGQVDREWKLILLEKLKEDKNLPGLKWLERFHNLALVESYDEQDTSKDSKDEDECLESNLAKVVI